VLDRRESVELVAKELMGSHDFFFIGVTLDSHALEALETEGTDVPAREAIPAAN